MDRPQSAFFFCCLCFTLVNFRFSLAAVDEQQILLAFKQQLVDSSNVLDNWNDSTPLCRWKGVSCDSASKSVTGIDFSNFHLNGTIPSIICELPNLTSLIFPWNNFRQSFPFWIAKCSKLSHLDLGQNFFSGPLPSNISISSLRHLDLSYNEFTGPVPADFGELSTLERLDLAGNRITTLAPELGKLSNLTYLSLMFNIHLIPAPIPPQFGKLSKITYLNLAYCQLIGEIPPELGDLKELDYLQLQSNNLTGSIPVELMFLPKLTKLELYINQLSGEIPQEVGNLVSLTDLDASQNFISGSIPERISELKNLRILHLENLVLFKNKLTGEIPRLLGINTNLKYFTVSKNMLSGGMPPYLCNGEALENVSLYANSFTGRIPESYGRCRSLLRFQLQDNSFEGPIPASLWASPKLTLLDISFNKFNGSVPSTIGGAFQLNYLILVEFTASSNRFSDSYPFGSCTSLANLNMSRNQLSGVISADVGNCLELNTLDLSANKLSGSIPSALGSLPRINALDLSDNQLSGFIPSSLGKPLLSMLNVSNNNLQGSLPGNWKNDFPSESFQGNPRLCVDRCPSATSSKDRDHLPVGLIVAIVIIGTVMLVIVGALSFCWRQHKLMHTPRWKVQSFQRLSFDEMTVVEKMEENNVVGCGRSSKVYRVDLANGQSVAVKELCRTDATGNDEEFEAEVRTLSSLRHRNIVKLLSCCTNLETSLLILEYMPNGSLGDHLHGKKVVNLDWQTRHKIAVGAAQGLSYLHHDCSPAILHRDIKSNNILLDSDHEPKLADFGIAKLLENEKCHMMTNVAGSFGYIAPEYAYNLKISEKSDTYSFGVVLLELVTGKKPVESAFGDCVDIVRWVRKARRPQEILDPRLRDGAEEQMIKFLDVALLCTSSFPAARPSMRQVVEMLKLIQPETYGFKSTTSETNSPASASASESPYDSYS